ncbi:unnamed protein product [Rhizoctonia solani]|uniref:Uncharacterized protein n=3 Tax=Rhizoctonia solani TaxID=456999 RepID=A0A8H3DQF2_9AGAM|nr:SUR7/PalI family protein [Rhizoctonia solani AG-3 Rhs1AP]KEP54534.1 SUR7/PalI family protein [Rhizoctonia solani 123E]CAE6497800.1 unnamed protein product [Rhizoctonia solani]CAE6539326.1 unnamed protein product [Rhizoctonia solani]
MPSLGSIVLPLVFVGFCLLLLVSLSTPIIKTISIFSIEGGDFWVTFVGPIVSGNVEFGVWGYCVSRANAFLFGFNVWQTEYCTQVRLGYDINAQHLESLGLTDYKNIITYSLMFLLALHPIACGLAFLALLFALMLQLPCRLPKRIPTMALVFLNLSAIVTTILLAIDLTILINAKNQASAVNKAKVEISYGNAPLMICGAMVALWAANIGACCSTSVSSRRAETEKEPSGSRKKDE